MSDKKAKSMNREEMEKIIREEEVGYLCMCMENVPYGLPLSYAFVDGKIVFHSKKTGKKMDFINKNHRVCFVVSRHPDRAMPHKADTECEYRFESVVCQGTARIVEDNSEKLEYLKKFKAHFDEVRGLDPNKGRVPEAAAKKTGIVVITIDEMTGRRKG